MWRIVILLLLLSSYTFADEIPDREMALTIPMHIPYPDCQLLSQITWGETPIAGTVRLHYNGWKAVAVNEARRQLYSFWTESLWQQYDGGMKEGYAAAIAHSQLSKSEDDLLGRWWERRTWELSSRQVLTTWEVGNPTDAIDLEVVKLTGDWKVEWREIEGQVETWTWRIKPRTSIGSQGLNNIGLLFNFGWKNGGRKLIDVDIWSGWDKRRGLEAGIAFEIWRY